MNLRDRLQINRRRTFPSPPPALYLFSVVELVALRRVAPRAAAQRLPANRAVRPSRSAAARGGVVAARQPLPLNRYPMEERVRWDAAPPCNAGNRRAWPASPVGTAEGVCGDLELSRPFGTYDPSVSDHPALKRWAIVGCPSGTAKTRGKRGSTMTNSQPFRSPGNCRQAREFASARVLLPRPTTKDYLFSVVELVALRRVAPRAAAQRLPANRA